MSKKAAAKGRREETKPKEEALIGPDLGRHESGVPSAAWIARRKEHDDLEVQLDGQDGPLDG